MYHKASIHSQPVRNVSLKANTQEQARQRINALSRFTGVSFDVLRASLTDIEASDMIVRMRRAKYTARQLRAK